MRVREGAAHLLGMLQSTRAGDRLSALWVVERMRLGGVVARVEALATTDPDERVRRRAQRVCDTLPKFEHAEAHGGKS
jgi:nitrogen-specific signal transduction histidine kinase